MNTKIVKMIYNPVAGQRHHRRFSKIVKLLKANFKKLEIAWFTELTQLHLDASFDFLEVLSIEDNFHLQSISGLENLDKLKELQIITCPELHEIGKYESIKEENIVIEACPKLNLKHS